MRNKIFLFGCLIFIYTLCISFSFVMSLVEPSVAQTLQPCGFDTLYRERMAHDEKFRLQQEKFLLGWQNEKQVTQAKTAQQAITDTMVFRIPVVFHIIHDNGPENIPDSLVVQSLEILNQCFRKVPGSIGDGSGVDTRIEFCLAATDPSGNPTSGITRTQSACTDETKSGCGSWLGSIIYWNDTTSRYLNIYIMRKLGGNNSGYAINGKYSGLVALNYQVLGNNSPYNTTLTHEVGHWLHLQHPFFGGCIWGDGIDDTPPEAAPGWCNFGINTCHNDTPDVNDLVENYMDYAFSCLNMFTNGQKDVMKKYLLTEYIEFVSGANLNNTGCSWCDTTTCPPVAWFKAPKSFAFVGESITYYDLSFNSPSSWQWTFSGADTLYSTLQNAGMTFSVPGTYNVELVVSNAYGSDTLMITGYLTIVELKPGNLGTGADDQILGMAIYKNELYVGGLFTQMNGISCEYAVKWNGLQWECMPDVGSSGFTVYENYLYFPGGRWDGVIAMINSSPPILKTRTMVVYNNQLWVNTTDGYLGILDTSSIGPWPAIWKMDTIISSTYDVKVMIVYDNKIYAGGDFTSIGGVPANNIAYFDGSAWNPIGGGLTRTYNNDQVEDMFVYDGKLLVGGWFDKADTVTAYNFAAWDGAKWESFGFYPDTLHSPRDFALWNGKLVAGGYYDSSCVASYDFDLKKWKPITPKLWGYINDTGDTLDVNGLARKIEIYNNDLYVGGRFLKSGSYYVNNIVRYGCDSLQAGFTQSTDTLDLTFSNFVMFSDTSINAILREWDFGGGATDTSKNTIHIFTQPGVYTVTLTVTGNYCALSATSKVVVIKSCPILNVGFTQNKDTLNLALDSAVAFYINPDISADSIQWLFSDGSSDTAKNPVHVFDSTGNYMVSLVASMDTCSATLTNKVEVIFNCSPVIACFTANKDTVDISISPAVQFSNCSKNTGFWLWNFGDNKSDTTKDVVHTFDTTGVYNVMLNAYNYNFTCAVNAGKQIVVINSTGIKETYGNGFKFSVYPNPVNNHFTIALYSPEKCEVELALYDITGRQVIDIYNGKIKKGERLKQNFNAGELCRGIYYLKVKGESAMEVVKVVKL